MLALIPALAAAADLHVGPTQPYTTLEDAFAAAAGGDRLLMHAGTFMPPTPLHVSNLTLEVQGIEPGVNLVPPAGSVLFDADNGGTFRGSAVLYRGAPHGIDPTTSVRMDNPDTGAHDHFGHDVAGR